MMWHTAKSQSIEDAKERADALRRSVSNSRALPTLK